MSDWATSNIESIRRPDGWAPIRKHFGIRGFGVNAWTSWTPGTEVIPVHDEGSGHEELYIVTAGSARFVVGDEEIDAPTGTLVHVADPATKRGAIAEETPTTIVSIGATPGEAFSPNAWEVNRDVLPLFERGDHVGVKRVLEQALAEYPDDQAPLLYNLACAEALLGERDEALGHLADCAARDPRYAEYARDDDDLASIRDDPRFPA